MPIKSIRDMLQTIKTRSVSYMQAEEEAQVERASSRRGWETTKQEEYNLWDFVLTKRRPSGNHTFPPL